MYSWIPQVDIVRDNFLPSYLNTIRLNSSHNRFTLLRLWYHRDSDNEPDLWSSVRDPLLWTSWNVLQKHQESQMCK